MKQFSLPTLVICFLIMGYFQFINYPKFQKERTEATIGWDVSGYYMYLPATFIYQDLRQCNFRDEIIKKYKPTPDFQQAFRHTNGNFVMKYPIGMAIQYTPAFFLAHAYCKLTGQYPADGFSFPYQLMISVGSFFVALIGLFILRKVLLNYFTEKTVAISLLALVVGTNYLNQAAIDNAMTHNYLFTIYALIIYLTIRFYKHPKMRTSIFIGALCGLAIITRPTEIISIIIPFIWALNITSKTAILERFKFLKEHFKKITGAVAMVILVGSIQLIYWKYAGGEWIIYSYGDQGFKWLRPHFYQCIFSYKAGWLVYTPIMVFALIGFIPLYFYKKKLFFGILTFSFLFMYLAFAWDIWWYGGTLGQRTMVQAYPVLTFSFAAFVMWMSRLPKIIQWGTLVVMGLFVYLNLWFTHYSHQGQAVFPGQMTEAYYWRTVGRNNLDEETQKLLDTDEIFEGKKRKNISLVFSALTDTIITLNKVIQESPEMTFPYNQSADWLRASADFRITWKEWEFWKMTQFIIQFKSKDHIIKERMIRVHRYLWENNERTVFFDISQPNEPFDSVTIKFWNSYSDKEIKISNLKVETFDE